MQERPADNHCHGTAEAGRAMGTCSLFSSARRIRFWRADSPCRIHAARFDTAWLDNGRGVSAGTCLLTDDARPSCRTVGHVDWVYPSWHSRCLPGRHCLHSPRLLDCGRHFLLLRCLPRSYHRAVAFLRHRTGGDCHSGTLCGPPRQSHGWHRTPNVAHLWDRRADNDCIPR